MIFLNFLKNKIYFVIVFYCIRKKVFHRVVEAVGMKFCCASIIVMMMMMMSLV